MQVGLSPLPLIAVLVGFGISCEEPATAGAVCEAVCRCTYQFPSRASRCEADCNREIDVSDASPAAQACLNCVEARSCSDPASLLRECGAVCQGSGATPTLTSLEGENE